MLTQEKEAVQEFQFYKDQKPLSVKYTATYSKFVVGPGETMQFITVEAKGQEESAGFHPLLTFLPHLAGQALAARFTNLGPYPPVNATLKPPFEVSASASVTQPQRTIIVEDLDGSHSIPVTSDMV